MKGLQEALGSSTGDPGGGVFCSDPSDDEGLHKVTHVHESCTVTTLMPHANRLQQAEGRGGRVTPATVKACRPKLWLHWCTWTARYIILGFSSN